MYAHKSAGSGRRAIADVILSMANTDRPFGVIATMMRPTFGPRSKGRPGTVALARYSGATGHVVNVGL
jgi:hypothetical protein